MRPIEFWAFAIFCAVMLVTASGTLSILFLIGAYVAALCALLASFKQFKRDLAVGQGG